jgi:hypothetical protein
MLSYVILSLVILCYFSGIVILVIFFVQPRRGLSSFFLMTKRVVQR